MAWTAKPNGAITLKSTGLAASLTKAWVIDEGSGDTWNEYVSGTDDITWPASSNTWNSNPTTATLPGTTGGTSTSGIPNINEDEGTLLYIFTPANYNNADTDIDLGQVAPSGAIFDLKQDRFQEGWEAQYRVAFGSTIILEATVHTSDAQLNQHTVFCFAFEDTVAYTTDNGCRLVVKKKDQPLTDVVTDAVTATGTGSGANRTLALVFNDAQASATMTVEGIFYWNTRLSDADMDTLADDPWGTLAETGGGSIIPQAMYHYRNNSGSGL